MSRTSPARGRAASLVKLSPPRLPAIVERIRLYRLLDRARRRPVVWIAAPPGFGKTTLVASYLRSRKLRSLWYQADAGDRDLASFFHYLGLAAQQAAPRFRRPLPHLTPEYLQGLPTFTRRFFEELYSRLKSPALLVLDNYQDVPPDAPFHEMVVQGLEAVPVGIGVIVISRTPPPPTFARLQAAQHIVFIDEEALRLTKPEARAIVRLHIGSMKPPKPSVIETLHEKLRGWVAGLVLQLEQAKAERMQQAVSPRETPQVIFDYLAREVMQRLNPEVQKFLLQTAFLPDMTAAMAANLTKHTNAGDMLTGLYHSRYFTERRAGIEHIYQYHPLFREFLRARAKVVLPIEEVIAIQHAAATLLESAGRTEDAVALYAEIGRTDEIIRAILARAPALLQQGRNQTVEGWLKCIPMERYEQEPWLYYWLASCRLPVAPLQSEAIFEKAFELFKAEGNMAGVLLTLAGVISSIQFSWCDISRFDRWIDIMLDSLRPDASFPSKEIDIQFTFCMLTALMWRRPERSFVTPWIERAKNLLEKEPGIERYSFFVGALANFLTWLGDLKSADKYFKMLKSAAESEASPPLMRIIYFTNGAVLGWNLGRPEESLRLAEQGLAISRKTGVHVFDAALLAAGAYGSLFRNDVAAADRYLKQSAPLVEHPAHVMRANWLFTRAWVKRIEGDLTEAWKLIQEALVVKGLKGSLYSEAVVTYAAADLLHELGDDQRAERCLSQVRSTAECMESFMLQFAVYLMEAHFAFDQKRDEAALKALQRALVIGRDHGFSFFFWWKSKTIARLCAKALEQKIEVEYVQELIRKTRLVPDYSVPISDAWPWPVKIYTLGRFEIHVDGQPLPPRRKAPYRVLQLLKAIVAFGVAEIAVSRLVDMLWPEAEGDTGQETFHKTLQRLRSLIRHDDVIRVRDGKVSLNRRLCWVDAQAFQDLTELADDSNGRQSEESRIRRYERAIALYRGPFLNEEASLISAEQGRERLRHRFVLAVQQVSEWQKGHGQDEAALLCLVQALKTDPEAEPLYPRLLLWFQQTGRINDARTVWAEYHRVMEAAGREPSAEMQRLAKNLSTL